MLWQLARSVAVMGMLVTSLFAVAQPNPVLTTDWQAANRDVVALVQAGRYAEAEARAKAAEPLCPAEVAARVICQTLLQENTAWAQARAGRFADAEASYQAALAARERTFAANDPSIGDSAAALGFFYIDRQRWDDAATQLERAVEILGSAGPDRTPALGAAYARLADAYRAQGRTSAAVTTAREAVETMTRRVGPDVALTQGARANLAAQLRDAGLGAEAIETALAALRPESLTLDQRLRLTIEAVTTANALGRTDAVRAVFETTLSLVRPWAESNNAGQRQGFAQLALAGSELALSRGDPDTALDLARQAKAAIAETTGTSGTRGTTTSIQGPLIQEARALLDQGQAEQAATLLTAAAGLDKNMPMPPAQLAWMVRALMDAGRLADARARLNELQASIAGKPEEQSSFGASLLQLAAQMAERQGDQRAALEAIEQAMRYLPTPGPGTANLLQAVNLRRDSIRLRALLGDSAGTAAALSALLAVQIQAQMPLQSQMETRMLLGWFGAETKQAELVRAQIIAMDAALPTLEAQAPRGAAMMQTRLAELSLTIPGSAGAAGAMAYLERARFGFDRTGQSTRDAARAAVLRGRILLRLGREADALSECRRAENKLIALVPGAESGWRDAQVCVVKAELQLRQYVPAAASAARLLEQLPANRLVERADAMRLLADAQAGQGETDAADRTLREALDLAADATPRRNGLRAEIWGAISANLHRAGRDREARNAAVAQRQIGNEDNAGASLAMQSLRHEATALLALQQLEEAITVLDRAERLRLALLRADPGLLQEHDTVLARVELARGRYAEAATVADRVIAAYRAQPAQARAGLAEILGIRASVDLAQGAFVAAETAQREALGLWNSVGGQDDEAALAWLALARIIAQRGDFVAAGRDRDQALEALARVHGATHPKLLLARLDAVPSLLRDGKLAEAGAVIDACVTGLKGNENRMVTACHLARSRMAAGLGEWPASREAAAAALDLLRARGDADRPALVAPLLALAEAAEAMGDEAAMQAAIVPLLPLLAQATLEERLRGAVLQARRMLWEGKHAEAEAASQNGLAMITESLPLSFAGALIRLTDTAAYASVAQGRAAMAVSLWRSALKRLDGWGGSPEHRGAALRGLGVAMLETPDLDGALQAWQDAATIGGGGETARRATIIGLTRAALAAGRPDIARRQAEDLAASASPGAALLRASLLAEIAAESGDNVSALLEWWRAASLAGEDRTDSAASAVILLQAARAALAAGQTQRARSLLLQARNGLAEPAEGSDAALASLEIDAVLHADDADAAVAVETWRIGVQRRFGAASRAALGPELALAEQEQRAGDNAAAAARLAVALGRAEQLRGRGSRLWAGIALQAAAAAERIGDTARAAALRQQAQAVLTPAAR